MQFGQMDVKFLASHDAFNFIARKSLNRFSIAVYVPFALSWNVSLN